jgi:hypothetical protein
MVEIVSRTGAHAPTCTSSTSLWVPKIEEEGLPKDALGRLEPNDVRLAKTASRQVPRTRPRTTPRPTVTISTRIATTRSSAKLRAGEKLIRRAVENTALETGFALTVLTGAIREIAARPWASIATKTA